MEFSPITSWKIDGETMKDFIFGGSKITANGGCNHEIKRCLLLGRKDMTNLDSVFKSRYGTMDWFQIGKVVCQGCIVSPCLFNLYVEYIMLNARLDESQARIKIASNNLSNLT